jgi:HK97 family phage portal protein
MGLVSDFFARRAHPSNSHTASLWGWGSESYTGNVVTEETALTYGAVFACIRIISESVAMLPLLTYRRHNDGGKERAADHPIYSLLHDEPNPEMSPFEFRELITSHVASWGNGYAEIEWSRGGRPLALWPLHPSKMKPERKNGTLRYPYELPGGQTVTLPAYRVLHIRGLGKNGIVGYSPVRLAMQAIGLGLGTEEYGARFFGNGARPGGVLKHPGKLSDTAYERLKKSFTDAHEGLSNAHRLKILEEGLDYQSVGIPPEEAQFLETRKFQVTEIARWWRIPPHMLADLERSTFANVYEMGQEFLSYTLQPWLTRTEQAYSRSLMTAGERKEYLIEHLVDGILRSDPAARGQFYQIMITNGVMSRNEVRIRENMNPYPGGDNYLVPLNMMPADGATPRRSDPLLADHEEACRCAACVSRETRADDDNEEDEATAATREGRQKLARDYIPLFSDVASRLVRREVNDVRRAVNKHLRKRSIGDFRTWLAEFYDEFAGVVAEAFGPLLRTYATAVATDVAAELDKEDPGLTDALVDFIGRYLASVGEGHAASSRNQIEALITDAESEGQDAADLIDERLDGWEETRGEQIALGQAFEAVNALTVSLFGYFSVRYLKWAASGASCPFCRRLSGRTVGIEQYFVQKGDTVSGGPDDAPMLVRRNTRHGPLHKGCDCVVVAA